MSRCASCGAETLGRRDLCGHHGSSCEDDWATGNRIMCDFVHRGIVRSTAPKPRRSLVEIVGARGEATLGD